MLAPVTVKPQTLRWCDTHTAVYLLLLEHECDVYSGGYLLSLHWGRTLDTVLCS